MCICLEHVVHALVSLMLIIPDTQQIHTHTHTVIHTHGCSLFPSWVFLRQIAYNKPIYATGCDTFSVLQMCTCAHVSLSLSFFAGSQVDFNVRVLFLFQCTVFYLAFCWNYAGSIIRKQSEKLMRPMSSLCTRTWMCLVSKDSICHGDSIKRIPFLWYSISSVLVYGSMHWKHSPLEGRGGGELWRERGYAWKKDSNSYSIQGFCSQ